MLNLQEAQTFLVGVGRITLSTDSIEEGLKERVLTFGFYYVAEIGLPAFDDVLVRGFAQMTSTTLEVGLKVECEVPAVRICGNAALLTP